MPTTKPTLRVTTLLLSLGLAWAPLRASAQTVPPGSAPKTSVLSTGGGQALLDTSDTVILLLDHQSGLFQTVKDIPVADLRSNVVMLAKLATLLKIPVITTASEPNGPNGPLDAGDPAGGAPRRLRAAQGRGERLGQRGLREGGQGHRQEDPDHGRRVDERLRDVPGAGREGGGLQGVRRHRRVGRSQRDGFEDHAGPLRPGRRRSHIDRTPSFPRPTGRGTVPKRPSSRSCTRWLRRTTRR